jgi:hypothetical protein
MEWMRKATWAGLCGAAMVFGECRINWSCKVSFDEFDVIRFATWCFTRYFVNSQKLHYGYFEREKLDP